MTDLIIAGIIVLVLGEAVTYIVKAKKNGVKCIGCPAGGTCSGRCSGDAPCSGDVLSSANTSSFGDARGIER